METNKTDQERAAALLVALSQMLPGADAAREVVDLADALWPPSERDDWFGVSTREWAVALGRQLTPRTEG